MLFEHKPVKFSNLILSSNNQLFNYKSGKGSLLFRVEPLTKKQKLLSRSKIVFFFKFVSPVLILIFIPPTKIDAGSIPSFAKT